MEDRLGVIQEACHSLDHGKLQKEIPLMMEEWEIHEQWRMPEATIGSLCNALRQMQWRADQCKEMNENGQETPVDAQEYEVMALVCTALAWAALDCDSRRHVRNAGGLKTLVQLLQGDVPEGVVAAASHALTNLAVDNINKRALRVCGLIERCLVILPHKNALTQQHLLVDSITNTLDMIDHDAQTILTALLSNNRLDSISTTRAALILTQIHTFLFPISPSKGIHLSSLHTSQGAAFRR